MKNIKYILKTFLLLLFTISIVSCNDDEYEAPGSFVDLSLTFTSGAGTNRESEVNRFFSFSDISAGAEYQEWRIPDNSFFLQGPIPNNLDNHDEYIKEPMDEKASTDKTVHVLFKKGDTLTKIGYFAIFPEETSFIFNSYWDSNLNSFVPDTVKTELINGKWIAEYEFTLDVYDTVVAKPEVRHLDGTVIDHVNTESITITYGDSLVFEDLSNFVENNNARPDETKWRPQTLEENEEERTGFNIEAQLREGDYEKRIIDTIAFTRLGDFRISLRAKRERTETVRENIDTILMPIIFKVVPLDEDLELDNSTISIEELDDDRIRIPISSPLAAIEGNVAGDFTVEVDGTAVPVETVSTGSYGSNGQVLGGFIFLTLDVPLQPSDAGKTVTVSYNGTDIMSRDERILQPFSAKDISVYVPTPMNQVGTVVESDNDEIQIRFDQDINPASISGSADPGAGFIIGLNGGVGTVETVSVNTDNPKILDITLLEGVFREDVITIAYTGPGDIRSIGDGTIADFTAQTVIMNVDDILNGDGGFNDASKWADNGNDKPNLAIGAPSIPDAPDTGDAAHLTAIDGKKPDLRSTGTYPFELGKTYIIKYKRFITSATTTAFSKTYVGGTQLASDQWGAIARDVWVDYEVEFTAAANSNEILRFQPVPAGVCDVYFDDLIVQEKETR